MHDDHLVIVEEAAKTIAKEVQAHNEGTGGTLILIEPLLDPLLLDPPLVEEAKDIVKEAQALDKGTGGIICIESLLDPFLLKPPLVVKLDVIQVVPEDSSGTHSTRTAISQLASKQRICVKGKGKRNKRTNEQNN